MKVVLTSFASIALAMVLITVMLVRCGTNLVRVYDEFPEQAKVENLRARFPQMVEEIDAAISGTTTKLSLAAELESINYPEEILLVAMHNYEDEHTGFGEDDQGRFHIVDRMPKRNKRNANMNLKIVANGGGYGESNGQHYWILRQPLKKYNYEYIEILIERPTPETPVNNE